MLVFDWCRIQWPWMILNAKNRGFYGFFGDFRLQQVCIIHKESPQFYYYVHFGMTVMKVFYFIPNSRKSNSNSDRFSLYDFIVLSSIFLMHSIWWNGLHRPILLRNLWYFVWCCCHLGNRFTVPSLVLGVVKHLYYSHAQVHIMLIDCIDWVVIFLRAKAATAFIAS